MSNPITGDTINLPEIGRFPAKRAADLAVGDLTIWPLGWPQRVEGLTLSPSGKTLQLQIRDIRDGHVRTLRLGLDHRVAVDRQVEPLKPASELKVGERVVWSHGYSERVEAIVPEANGRKLALTLRDPRDQHSYTRSTMADRLVAVESSRR